MTTITGHTAIDYAAATGASLSKYQDPTEEARHGLTLDEAREIAAEDPSLIYIESGSLGERIEALRTEAGQAGDLEQVAICDRALAGDEAAIAECVRVITDAAAQGED